MWYRKPKIMVTETGGLNIYYLYTGQQRLLERMSPLKIRIKKEGRTRQAKSSPPPLFVNKIHQKNTVRLEASFVHVLPLAASTPQRQNSVVTEPTKPNVFIHWPFTDTAVIM